MNEGFVLLSVLVVIGIISATLISLTISVRAHRSSAATERRLTQAIALADAGLTRIIAMIEVTNDDFLSDFSVPVRWKIAGQEVTVSVAPEASKVDLNAGDSALVANVLKAAVENSAKTDRMLRRLAEMRRAGEYLDSVRGLLEPSDRVGRLARDLEAVFTVWTNLRGVDPKSAPAIVLRNMPGLQPGEAELLVQASARRAHSDLSPFVTRFGSLLGGNRPIYRARAEAKSEGVTVKREALLAYNPSANAVRVVFWRDVTE